MERNILHCDCNSFFASVELLKYPHLTDKPVAVCGDPKSRKGIILAKNEIAKSYRIQTAETVWSAKRKCPELILLPSHHEEYAKYSSIINEIYYRYTDLVEPFGIDESWLDVTGSLHLFGGDVLALADEIRRTVKHETGITISIGVSFNKAFAKLGSDYKKPDAITHISHDMLEKIAFPLPVSDFLHVGKYTVNVLNMHGIYTIGEFYKCSSKFLEDLLGKTGKTLYDTLHCNDMYPVRSYSEKRDVKSVGNGTTFKNDLVSRESIKSAVITLSDTVAMRLRKYNLKCSTVQIVVKYPNFKSITRQIPLAEPTLLSRDISSKAMELIEKAVPSGTAIRMITITALGLVDVTLSSKQITLFAEEQSELNNEKIENLENAVYKIKQKYGKNSIFHIKKDS